ncbi:MAG: ribosome-associated translation inhibitor RaiA [Pirellulaceae bacterium]
MQVNVSARHGSLTAHDQQFIQEKAEKVRRILDTVNAIEVIVDFQHQEEPNVEINVSAEHAPDFVASASASNVVSALDAAIQKVEQQLRKHKDKTTAHKVAGGKHVQPVDEEAE